MSFDRSLAHVFVDQTAHLRAQNITLRMPTSLRSSSLLVQTDPIEVLLAEGAFPFAKYSMRRDSVSIDERADLALRRARAIATFALVASLAHNVRKLTGRDLAPVPPSAVRFKGVTRNGTVRLEFADLQATPFHVPDVAIPRILRDALSIAPAVERGRTAALDALVADPAFAAALPRELSALQASSDPAALASKLGIRFTMGECSQEAWRLLHTHLVCVGSSSARSKVVRVPILRTLDEQHEIRILVREAAPTADVLRILAHHPIVATIGVRHRAGARDALARTLRDAVRRCEDIVAVLEVIRVERARPIADEDVVRELEAELRSLSDESEPILSAGSDGDEEEVEVGEEPRRPARYPSARRSRSSSVSPPRERDMTLRSALIAAASRGRRPERVRRMGAASARLDALQSEAIELLARAVSATVERSLRMAAGGGDHDGGTLGRAMATRARRCFSLVGSVVARAAKFSAWAAYRLLVNFASSICYWAFPVGMLAISALRGDAVGSAVGGAMTVGAAAFMAADPGRRILLPVFAIGAALNFYWAVPSVASAAASVIHAGADAVGVVEVSIAENPLMPTFASTTSPVGAALGLLARGVRGNLIAMAVLLNPPAAVATAIERSKHVVADAWRQLPVGVRDQTKTWIRIVISAIRTIEVVSGNVLAIIADYIRSARRFGLIEATMAQLKTLQENTNFVLSRIKEGAKGAWEFVLSKLREFASGPEEMLALDDAHAQVAEQKFYDSMLEDSYLRSVRMLQDVNQKDVDRALTQAQDLLATIGEIEQDE